MYKYLINFVTIVHFYICFVQCNILNKDKDKKIHHFFIFNGEDFSEQNSFFDAVKTLL